jgi:hypothetical protein
MIGKTCKIKKEYCNTSKESDLLYEILSNPNTNNRIDIIPVKWDWSIKPIESIDVNMIVIL